MKNLMNIKNRLVLLIMTLFASVMTYAQDAKLDVNVTKSGGDGWYSSPVVWIIGIAVFVLLLAAVLRGGRRTDA